MEENTREKIAPWGISAFLAGVFASSAGAPVWFLIFGASAYAGARCKRIGVALILIGCALFGSLYAKGFYAWQDGKVILPERGEIFDAQVSDLPVFTAKGFIRVPATLRVPYRGKVNIVTEPRDIRYGDTLRIVGDVVSSDWNAREYFVFADEITRTARGEGNALRNALFRIKGSFEASLKKSLPSEEAALTLGMLLGIRDEFSASFREAMQKSGTTHIVALSGFNVAILIGALFSLFLGRFPRRVTIVITISVIVLFVVMVGAEPSIIRAAAMGIMALLAREMGRSYRISHAVIYIAAAMALVDPYVLLEPGFQLSFAGFLGLAYGEPRLREWLCRSRWFSARERLASYFASALGAQLAVIPIVIFNFQSVSIFSLPANLLIVFVVPLTMLMGFVVAGAGFVSLPFASVASLALLPLVRYEIGVIRWFGSLQGLVSVTHPLVFAVIYYAILGWIMMQKKHEPLA